MNIILTRAAYRADGIFSNMCDEARTHLFYTLEHAYGDAANGYLPKLPPGVYECVRGMHTLQHSDGRLEHIETFEITGIAGHSGVLFHVGNKNADSNGCVLVGETIMSEDTNDQIVTNSRASFEKFMALQAGVDKFSLTVEA